METWKWNGWVSSCLLSVGCLTLLLPPSGCKRQSSQASVLKRVWDCNMYTKGAWVIANVNASSLIRQCLYTQISVKPTALPWQQVSKLSFPAMPLKQATDTMVGMASWKRCLGTKRSLLDKANGPSSLRVANRWLWESCSQDPRTKALIYLALLSDTLLKRALRQLHLWLFGNGCPTCPSQKGACVYVNMPYLLLLLLLLLQSPPANSSAF